MSGTPSVLFVCVKNAGKSQMAAGLLRHAAGNTVRVDSAGTNPGTALNALSAQSLAEIGVDVHQETPKPITPQLLAGADLVITLGQETTIDPTLLTDDTPVENWDTDEPLTRGIEGLERMRLIREDISTRVNQLADQLGPN